MRKLYQIHQRYEVENHVVHIIKYLVSDGELLAHPIEEDWVEYALEVCPQTLHDEICHCEKLIQYWKERPDYPKVDIIIKRQENRIALYKELLCQLGE